MKCRDCGCCRIGYFQDRPNDYVCTGVKHPFIIDDVNVECTEYLDRSYEIVASNCGDDWGE